MTYVLASSHSTSTNIGGDQLEDIVPVKFFAFGFIKKTPLTVCPSTNIFDNCAEAKLRLAIEHTSTTISACPGAAKCQPECSVESLKGGVDYAGSISRMRFEIVVNVVYLAVAFAVRALGDAGVDTRTNIDEIVYVGGPPCLPDLGDFV